MAVLAMLLGLVAPVRLRAQGTSGADQGATGAAVRDAQASDHSSGARTSQALRAMKSDLQRLVGVNQVYHAKTGRYSTSVGGLQGYRASPGVAVTIVQASSTGWAAQATSASLPGRSCVIFVGTVPPPTTLHDKRSGPEAVPTCDGP